MYISEGLFNQLVCSLIGIFIGTLAATAVERMRENARKRQRALIVLRSLYQELNENFQTLKAVRPDYINTPWGKSFYIGTIAWETALSSGDLPDIIGFQLTDKISSQYALLIRTRYYLDLLTQLWFSPADIPGYEEKRKGFNHNILENMNKTIDRHWSLAKQIEEEMKKK